jgi:hypothetical protein
LYLCTGDVISIFTCSNNPANPLVTCAGRPFIRLRTIPDSGSLNVAETRIFPSCPETCSSASWLNYTVSLTDQPCTN